MSAEPGMEGDAFAVVPAPGSANAGAPADARTGDGARIPGAPDLRPAGYSGTPLPKKLGLKSGQRLAFVNEPAGFRDSLQGLTGELGELAAPDDRVDLALLFTREEAELRREFPALAARLHPAGMLWVAWPKRASKVATDLTGDRVRAVGLEAGLVDVKVCAIDEVWSGLKFVFRLADRAR